jgi:pyruvate,water dikinase
MSSESNSFVRWLADLSSDDVGIVGGKNASLGEMIATLKEEGIRVPDGFATTAEAYRLFLKENDLEQKLRDLLKELLEDEKPLDKVGKSIRRMFHKAEFPEKVEQAIAASYEQLCKKYDVDEVDVAVRSSATAEDLPEASFAGQQETYLNITGSEDVLDACKKCFASLFTDRAISYRNEHGFDHLKVALSVGIQKMVRSDQAGSGVMFSIDTETGFPDAVVINAAWGLGENVVQGSINPDEYVVFKPLLTEDSFRPIIDKVLGDKAKKMVYTKGGTHTTKNTDTSNEERRSFVLTDDEILELAKWAAVIEKHYEKPMDMEWAKDGQTGELFIIQARPETVQSQKQAGMLKTYTLKQKGSKITEGLAIGQAISAGKVQNIKSAEQINRFEDDSILVTGMTDPDWVPIMKRASGIVTDHGGRTSHAAIVSRELGIPAIVGTGDATEVLQDGQDVTISCAQGDRGYVYEGILDFEQSDISLEEIPGIETQIMMNLASPAAAFRWWQLPCDGVGLARMEFIINNIIKIHPLALVHFDELEDKNVKKQIQDMCKGYEDKSQYFVDHLARGISRISASQYPAEVIVRLSDFKTNEYANLIGGAEFEPEEGNPMLGFRGASRYYSEQYREGFALECRAIKAARETIGLKNILVMVPFCRTIEEADRVLEVMAENGLEKGADGLRIYVMAEIPSNIIQAEEFAERFDGFSIGSNDLTQLVLGVDRDSEQLSHLFDARNESVKRMVGQLVKTAHSKNCKVGICGQAPSDHPDFAEFLVECGIDSMSLNPDSVIKVITHVTQIEHQEGAAPKIVEVGSRFAGKVKENVEKITKKKNRS